MTVSAFETELTAQVRAAAAAVAAAEADGDDVLADAMRARLDDLVALGLRQQACA
jgi:hypothetical protein